MKKILTAVLSLAMLGVMSIPAFADETEPPLIAPAPAAIAEDGEAASSGYAIKIDGVDINANAYVMVPLRAVAEKLGFTVTWDNGTVIVEGSGRYIELTIGEDQYFAAPNQEGVLGASLFSLGCAPYVNDSTTYVPLELFDVLLGGKDGAVSLDENSIEIHTDLEAMPIGGDPATWGPALEDVQIPSPFVDHATLDEAVKIIGFPLVAPDKLDGYNHLAIQTMGSEMIQLIFQDGTNSVIIRKAAGEGNISGNCNQYAETKTINVNGFTATLKGEKNMVEVAIWEHNGYTYAITADAGISTADMTTLIQTVK